MARITVDITRKLRRIYEVQEGTTIGRDSSCAIQLLNKSVSRIHARFERDEGKLKIVDLASANGIKINGERLYEHTLSNGDSLQIGKIEMHYELSTESIAAENIIVIDENTDTKAVLTKVSALNAIRMETKTERDLIDSMVQIGEGFIRTRQGFSGYESELLAASMREAVTNAENHGNKSDASKSITLSFHDTPNEITIMVKDEGAGFDFGGELERSQAGSAIDSARDRIDEGGIGGLGIRLMLSASDHINYLLNGSRVEIVKEKHMGISAVDTRSISHAHDSDDFIVERDDPNVTPILSEQDLKDLHDSD